MKPLILLMSTEPTTPYFNGPAFNCPHCAAYAQMRWSHAKVFFKDEIREDQGSVDQDFKYSNCIVCKYSAIWDNMRGRLLWPITQQSRRPHQDLPEHCATDFMEASEIAEQSPRAAAALLRLCIQKLCAELGQPGKNLNQDIAALVKQGLSTQVQQALDAVRVIGNEAVHPGTLTTEDHAEHVGVLFDLINIIVEQLITQPAKVAALYDKLPVDKRAAIEDRDKKATPQS